MNELIRLRDGGDPVAPPAQDIPSWEAPELAPMAAPEVPVGVDAPDLVQLRDQAISDDTVLVDAITKEAAEDGHDQSVVDDILHFMQSPTAARAVMEGVMSAAPQFKGVKLTADLIAKAGIKFIPQIAQRMGLSGAGAAVGSGISETFDPSEDPWARAKEAALFGAAGEGVGSVLFNGAQFVMRPLGKKVSRYAKYAQAKMQEVGGSLTPSQMAPESWNLRVLESIADSAIMSGGRITAARKATGEKVQEIADAFVAKYTSGRSREDIGALVQDAILGAVDTFRVTAGSKYGALDEAIRTGMEASGIQGVPTSTLKVLALKLESEMGLKAGSPGTAAIIKDVMAQGDIITFKKAQQIRSDLLMVSRQSDELVAGKAQASAKRLANSLDKVMRHTAEALPPGTAKNLWRDANAFWKDGMEKYQSSMMKALIKAEPEEVFRRGVLNSSPRTVKRIRDIVGAGSDEWKSIQGQFLEEAVFRSANAEGAVIGARLMNYVRRFSGVDKVKYSTLFPKPKDRANINSLAKIISKAQYAPPDTLFKFVVSAGQLSLVVNALAFSDDGPDIGEAVGWFGGPLALSLFLTNPKALKWLRTSVTVPAKFAHATKAGSKLGAAITNENASKETPEVPSAGSGYVRPDFLD